MFSLPGWKKAFNSTKPRQPSFFRPQLEALEDRTLLSITQITTSITDHRWPSLNNNGDIVYSSQVNGVWQVFLNGQQITGNSNNNMFPSISDSGDVVYFRDGGSGGIGWQVIRRSANGSESTIEFSSRNSFSGAHRDANKYSGIASNGTSISGYNFYDSSGTFFAPTQRFNVSGVGQLPFNFGGSYNYPDINAQGDVLFASVGGFFSSPRIYKTTTSGPFPGTSVTSATMGRINDSGDIVTVSGDLNSPGSVRILTGPGYTETTFVGSGSWADINNSRNVVFENLDAQGRRQIYLFRSNDTDIAPTSLSWNTAQGGVDFSYQVTGGNLPQDTTAALYWADADKNILSQANRNTISIAAPRGSDQPIHVATADLTTPAADATQLLLVVDATDADHPHGLIEESNEDNNSKAIPFLDTDGDGLYDLWETKGIDFNGDGVIDLNLPALDAKSDHKDLFVEVDAMTGRAPTQGTLNRVVSAFANAPVVNPDGQTGVTLHLLLDETAIPLGSWANVWSDFDIVKSAHFGTLAERNDPNWVAIREAKRLVYRYSIFADMQSGTTSSGLAELPGNDFMVITPA